MKIGGFYASRRRDSRPSFLLQHWRWALLLLVLLLWILGLTRAWSQSSESKSTSSDPVLQAWESISERFQLELNALRMNLLLALSDAEASKTSSGRWMSLYENSLTRIASLETFNGQIAERMQERDEDLAMAYDDINRLQKQRLKMIVGLVIMGASNAILFILMFNLLKKRK